MRKYLGIFVALALVFVGLASVQPSLAVSGDSLLLENKDTGTWAVIADGRSGTLDYNTSGNTFDFSFTATGLEASTDYSLIYYANPWPGSNPGKLIGTGTSDGSGNLAILGSPDLGMSLPTPPDSNMVVDHCVAPDLYGTCYGAKIWLVPSACYSEPAITTWSPERFLFETDLIVYTDTNLPSEDGDVTTTVTITEPQARIGLSISPLELAFGSVDIGSCSALVPVTLTNEGNVPIKVTITTSAGFNANCLKLSDDTLINGWISPTIPVGDFLVVNIKACPTIAYNGTIPGSISFDASFSP